MHWFLVCVTTHLTKHTNVCVTLTCVNQPHMCVHCYDTLVFVLFSFLPCRINELIKEMSDVRKKVYLLDGVDCANECAC